MTAPPDAGSPRPLQGSVAVVAGATRGAGRGIAVELGAAGATVYVTGRSTRGNLSPMGRPETIEETGELVNAVGGVGIPVRVDHTSPEEVLALFDRVAAEQDGRLDLLVNDVWGGDPLSEWGTPFWEQSIDGGPGDAAAGGVDAPRHQPVRGAADGGPRTGAGDRDH